MLIPIDEIYFKEKVKIKFDNIIQGFNNYKNKTIKAIDNKDFDFMQKQKEHSLAVMEIFDKSRKQIN